MIRFSLALLLLHTLTWGAIALEEIRATPASRLKDFLIFEYLRQPVTPAQADAAFYELDGASTRFLYAWAKKTAQPEVKKTVQCLRLSIAALKKSTDADCVRLGLSVGKLSAMKPEERTRLGKLLGDPFFNEMIAMLNRGEVRKHYTSYTPKKFLQLFNGSYGAFRRREFNFAPDAAYMNRLAKTSGFTSAMLSAMDDRKLATFAKALTSIKAVKIDARTNFYLGLNQLRHDAKAAAIAQFRLARELAPTRERKDKALFWEALVSGDEAVWSTLRSSWDINFYALYAHQRAGSFPTNYFTTLVSDGEKRDENLSHPLVWDTLKSKIAATPKAQLYDLAERFSAPKMLPVHSYVVEKASSYRLQSYIMPYDAFLTEEDNETKAIIYALMRQESRFIPAALSPSYALGLMQIMPFLCRALDKEVQCGRDHYFDMFDPETNLRYARTHLDWLRYRVYHPLFIAYAYNGGIGFTKRYLESGTFKKGPYEPFMSMEMMRRNETREYGKKVLTHYVVYKKILGEPVSLIDLTKTLLDPAKTDRFRK